MSKYRENNIVVQIDEQESQSNIMLNSKVKQKKHNVFHNISTVVFIKCDGDVQIDVIYTFSLASDTINKGINYKRIH